MQNGRFILYIFILFTIPVNSQSAQTFKKLKDSASILLRGGNGKEAFHLLQEMDTIAKREKSDSLKLQVFDRLGFYYFVQGDYEASTDNVIKAIDLAKAIGKRQTYLDLSNNLGMIWSKIDEYERAEKVYKTLLSEVTLEEDAEIYVSTISNLGSVYLSLNQLEKSELLLKQARVLSKEKGIRFLEAAVLKFLAKNKLLQGEYVEVIELVKSIKNDFWDIIQRTQKDDAIFYRAQAYFHLGEYNLAASDIDEALSLMNILKKDPAYIERVEFKSKILQAQRKYKDALSVQQEAVKLRDSFNNEQRLANVLEIESKYEAEKKERENAELKAQNSQQELIIANKNNLILVVVIIAILILSVLFIWQLRKSKNKNKQLKSLINNRSKLLIELKEVRDNIAKDFHDDMGNKLARITTISDHIIQEKETKTQADFLDALTIIKRDANELYSGTRDFMFSLRAESDTLEDVYAYIADFALDYINSFDKDIDLIFKNDANPQIPYYWNRQIILICKEAITNAIKHSNCETIILSFILKNNFLFITIKDNGAGFKQEKLSRKNGLNNMVHRARRIHCSLAVVSNDSGTEIKFEGQLPDFEILKIA
ncbi:hypothetical protein EAX61_12275 [Dokdonia sinensis]|uniref:histidine kinase n=1 Tax=Dokdonia sinensis TaxID=2479847 RepID=A0A3M0FWJ9_9FLAO|nr:tetratricopeptide repeat-containing sensor histidine kinase [Dokdonia sinensis]RMB57140.1 hypothetical protein EAX61_12275 [Dokdonia sinensis]